MSIISRPTQMIILPIKSDGDIEDKFSKEGRIWAVALNILEKSPGFRRLYWGRHVEEPGKTQIHVGMCNPHHRLLRRHDLIEKTSAR
jgi:hypothetical protein